MVGLRLSILWMGAALALSGCQSPSLSGDDARDLSDAAVDTGGKSDNGESDAGMSATADGGPSPSSVEASPGGNTLWIGNSLVRHGDNGSYDAYSIPDVVQALRDGASTPTPQEMRILAQDGFGLEGWWNSWFGYNDGGTVVSAARAIVEDPAADRSYASELGFSALAPASTWNRIIVLSLLNYLGESAWYGDVESGAVVPNIERWYGYIQAEQPGAEILHYVGVTDGREILSRQPMVDAIYADLQETWGGRIVPVGRAFYDVELSRPELELRRPDVDDYIHFNDAGVYLAACVFYGVLYGDPEGLTVPSGLSVSGTDASFLRGIAKAAVMRVSSAAF